MKIISVLLMSLTLFVSPFLPLYSRSVASTDDFMSPIVNPAAIGFGNAQGVTFIGYYDGDVDIDEQYRLLLTTSGFSFNYGKLRSGNDYSMALGNDLLRNVYLGSDISWQNGKIKDALYGASLLARPTNCLSIGLNVQDVFNAHPTYITGLALRPLNFIRVLENRFTVTAESAYKESYDDVSREVSWAKPTVGLETELVNGLFLKGAYDLESETIGFDISLAVNNSRIGSTNSLTKENELISGNYYIHLADKNYRSLPLFMRDKTYKLKLNKKIVDEQTQRKFGPFVTTRKEIVVEDLISDLHDLKTDPTIKTIVIKNPNFNTDYAILQRLERELTELKAEGKEIIVYAENYGNLQYAFFASVADKMFLNPNGSIGLVGFNISIPYVTELLSKLGIEIIDLKSHSYKTGMNIFTENQMTDEERETYQEIVDLYYQEMVNMISSGRGHMISADIEKIIDNGPYFEPQEALQAGLIDGIYYEDEFDEYLKKSYRKQHQIEEIPKEEIQYVWRNQRETIIALIHASGNIMMGKGEPGTRIGAETLSKQIRRARKDNSVKGIILRVNSGGGSAYASDVIAREIVKCKEAGKPVIVSMGGMAASGGYYIAAYADEIVAEETTLTGSIGVTGLIPNMSKMFEKIGVNWSYIKKGENADLVAIYKEIEAEDIALLKKMIDSSYDKFVNVAVEGRGMSYDQVHELAQGRVWTGKRAHELGLVDHLGGMDLAIELMQGYVDCQNLRIEDYSFTYGGFMASFADLEYGVLTPSIVKTLMPAEVELMKRYREYFMYDGEEKTLYIARPFEVGGME